MSGARAGVRAAVVMAALLALALPVRGGATPASAPVVTHGVFPTRKPDAVSAAVPRSDARDRVRVVKVEWGWGGVAPAERWTPVTITLDATTRATSGTITLSYTQDSSQRARHAARFATTPGRPTTVRLLAALPRALDEVRLGVEEDGEWPRTLVFDRARATTLDENGGYLGAEVTDDAGVVVGVGVESLSRAAFDASERGERGGATPWTGQPAPQLSGEALAAWRARGVRVAAVAPEALPASWMAYDGVEAVVVRGEAVVDPAAREAVRRWVSAGGTLVIMADQPGEAWRAWLPEDGAAGAVALRESRRVTPGEQMSAALQSLYPETEARSHEAAETIPAREVVLGEAAARAGWRAVARSEGAAGAESGAGSGVGTVLAAMGPAGLGRVMVVGFEPERVPAILDRVATRKAWHALLRPALEEYLARQPIVEFSGMFVTMGSFTDGAASGATLAETQAVGAAMNLGASGVRVGAGMLLAVGATIVGLGLLLGPVDYLMLRALRARHRAWATALGWIALTSGVAAALPRVLRSGESVLARVEVVDAVMEEGAGGVGLTARGAWRAGVASAFMGLPGRAGLGPAAGAERAWVRGVGAGTLRAGTAGLRATLTTAQEVADGAWGERAGLALPVSMRQWTLRGAAYDGPLDALPVVISRERRGGDVVFTLRPAAGAGAGAGVGAGAESARMVIDGASWADAGGERTAPFAPVEGLPGAWRVMVAGEGSPAEPEGWAGVMWMAAHADTLLSLPGAARRTAGLAERAKAPGWGVLTVRMTGPWSAGERTRDGSMAVRRTTLLRVAVPIEGVPGSGARELDAPGLGAPDSDAPASGTGGAR